MSKKSNKYAGYQPGEVYDPTGVSQYLGLGRPIEFDDWTTRIAMLCTILAGVATLVWQGLQGVASSDAAMSAVGAALGFLFAYMLALELDPDRKLGGIIGGGLTILAYNFLGEGNPFALLWLLFVLRMLNRSSGDRHRIADNVIIIGAAAWLGNGGYWAYPLLTGAAYVLESQVKAGYFRSLYLAGIAMATLFFADYSVQANLSLDFIILLSITFVVFLPEIRCANYVKAKGDKSGKRLIPSRLQATQGFFLLAVFSLIVLHGDSQALSMLPAMAAATGVGAYLLVALVQHKVV